MELTGATRQVLLVVMTATLMVLGVVPQATGAPSAATVVGTDATGDWGDIEVLAPLGDALGQDLVEASIERPDPASVRFVMTFTNLPEGDPFSTGLYAWGFTAGKQSRGLFSCGQPTAECDAPDNFMLTGECTYKAHPVLGDEMPELECEELGEVSAEIDLAAKTIAATVPLEMIGAEAGQVLKMKRHWVWAASPALLMAGYGDSEGNAWSTYLNFDVLEMKANYRI